MTQGTRKRFSMGIQGKLISLLVFLMALPAVLLAWYACERMESLGWTLRRSAEHLAFESRQGMERVSRLATAAASATQNGQARHALERATMDMAERVAAFLYERDADIRLAALLEPDAKRYRAFLNAHSRPVSLPPPWSMNAEGTQWEMTAPHGAPLSLRSPYATNIIDPIPAERAREPRAFPVEGLPFQRVPLFLEMTFVDTSGRERVKVTTSPRMASALRDITKPANTYCKAERYFEALKALAPGEIYVSPVVGEYIPATVQGTYSRAVARMRGMPFTPEDAAYAGRENPVGRHFEGLVRWAMPVMRNGSLAGWVTLALDHRHLMEFVEHVDPVRGGQQAMPDVAAGGFGSMWDNRGRNISHPRAYHIVGYNADSGEPAPPWLDETVYQEWQESGKSIADFVETRTHPIPAEQAGGAGPPAKPSEEMRRKGLLGLDGRFLSFAPQSRDWLEVIRQGGFGSAVHFWEGAWRVFSVAIIPYYTGQYGRSLGGFGSVAMTVNEVDLHAPAVRTAQDLDAMVREETQRLSRQEEALRSSLRNNLDEVWNGVAGIALGMLTFSVMLVIVASRAFSRKLAHVTQGLRRLQAGDMDHRLPVEGKDEMSKLCQAFNDTIGTMKGLVEGLRASREEYRNILANTVAGIFRSDAVGGYAHVNAAFANLLGYDSPEQLAGEVRDIAVQIYADPQERLRLLQLVEEQGEVADFEFRALRRDGSTIWLCANIRGVRSADGSLDYLEGVAVDVTNRKDMEEANRNRQAAEARDQAKSAFLANMSHEIRTPMNAIIGVAELLREGETDAERKKLVALLHASGEHLLVLINDILEISQIEAGKLKLHTSVFDLAQTIGQSVALMQVKAKEKGLVLSLHMEKGLPRYVRGDVARLRQVLLNLIGNAIKFTERGAVVVRVGVTETMGNAVMLSCSVQDTGRGISAGKLENIFESFVQLDASSTRRYSGTGLGLSISRRLVELMGGDLTVQSTPEMGSTFTFRLPLVISSTPPTSESGERFASATGGDGDDPEYTANADARVLGPAMVRAAMRTASRPGAWGADAPDSTAGEALLREESVSVTSAAGGEAAVPEWAQGLRVLYVDDSESNRMLMALYMSKTGIQLDIAQNGEEGLEALRHVAYDAVLLDMEMPDMDGYQVAAAIRAQDKKSLLPIIALTANVMAEDRQRCLDAGCSEYLAKPVRKDALLAMLRAQLEEARRRNQSEERE